MSPSRHLSVTLAFFFCQKKDLVPLQAPTLIRVVRLFPIFVTRLEHWISGVLTLSETSSTALEGQVFPWHLISMSLEIFSVVVPL